MSNKDESLLLITEYPDHIAVMSPFCHREHRCRVPAEDTLQRDLKRNISEIV